MIPAVWAIGQGTLNAFTNQPLAISRKIPFLTHGQVETVGVPALVAITLASGAMKEPTAKRFFIGLFTALGIVYTLTDWKATPKNEKCCAHNWKKDPAEIVSAGSSGVPVWLSRVAKSPGSYPGAPHRWAARDSNSEPAD